MNLRDITIYSTPNCKYCRVAKEMLTERGLQYTEIDVSNNPEMRETMVQMSKQRGVPVIVIDDNVIVGAAELAKILESKVS